MWNAYRTIVSRLIYFLTGIACVSVMLLVVVTCIDIVMRRIGYPLPGAIDIVQLAACVAAACALPYTTAVKGHVAVEFFFQNLPRRARTIVDSFSRVTMLILFAAMSYRCILHGNQLLARQSVSLTLKIPLFWVLWLMSFSLAVVVLVKLYHLTHPGKEMMKP